MFNLVGTAQAQTLGKIGQGSNFLLKNGTIYSGGTIHWDALVRQAVTILFFVSAIASLIFLIWGGFLWITSGGDKGKVETARNKIVYAVIGLLVVGAAYAIWHLALRILGAGEVLNPGF